MEIIGTLDRVDNQAIKIIIPADEKPRLIPADIVQILFEIRKAYTVYWLCDQGRSGDADIYAKCDSLPTFDLEAGLRIKNIFGDETLTCKDDKDTEIKIIIPSKNNPDVLLEFLTKLKSSWDNKQKE